MATDSNTDVRPFRIIILGSDMKPKKIYVIIGKVSNAVSSALQRYRILSTAARKSADKLFADTFGDCYRLLLVLDAAQSGDLSKYSPPAINPMDIVGSYDTSVNRGHAPGGSRGHAPGGSRGHAPGGSRGHAPAVSAWYDPNDEEGLADILEEVGQRSGGSSIAQVTVNVSEINDTILQYSADWFNERQECVRGSDLTTPILVTRVGPDLVPRGEKSICAVRRAMELGVKTLPAVIKTTTPMMSSRTIKYNDEMTKTDAGARYPNISRIIRTFPREVTGGLLEDDEIEALLNEDIVEAEPVKITYSTGIQPPKSYADEPAVEYITSFSVFSVDKFTELAEKIQLAAGIPMYRQHTFWIDGGQIKTSYLVSANGAIETDIRMTRTGSDKTGRRLNVLGIPVNNAVYNRRDIVRIESYDAFKIVGATTAVFVADLADWMAPIRSQIQDIIHDSYQMDMLYWGFVALYWPRLTRECFHVYASAEASIPELYPDLMPPNNALKSRFSEEQEWFSHVRSASRRVEAFARTNITTAVIDAIVTVKNAKVVLNLRNIIDFINTTPEIPEIRAHIQEHPRKYIIRKLHASHTEITWPSGLLYRSGLIFVVRIPGYNRIFINIGVDGTLNVRISAPEEESIGFDEIYDLVIRYANPIIEKINNMGRYVFVSGTALATCTRTNMIFGSLNMCMYWKRVISSSAFNGVKAAFDRLMSTGVAQPRAIQQADKHELMFRKGMHKFDTTLIDRIMAVVGGRPLMNQYTYLSVANVKQKWDHSYSGRIIRIGHRTTDIRLEIVDVREDEFRILAEHVNTLLFDVSNDMKTLSATAPKTQRRLRKLREEDPDLFNLKKYGSKKVYSILCQNTRQPVIYTADEVNAMDAASRKKLVKYINFTKNSPAYYACPSSVYPNLGFLVGSHPKGYCLPCCNKRMQAGRKTDIFEKCSTCGKWTGEAPGDSSRHIMSYSKVTDVGRLSKLPASIHKTLNPAGGGYQRGRRKAENTDSATLGINTSRLRGYYVLGIEQSLPGIPDAGFAHTCARMLGITIDDMFKAVIDKIKSSDIFMTSGGGQLASVWESPESLIESLRDLFILKKTWTVKSPPEWDVCAFNLIADTFNIGIAHWHDLVSKTTMECILPSNTTSPDAYIMIIQRNEHYSGIVQVSHSEYSRNGIIGELPEDDRRHTSRPRPGQFGGTSGGLFSAEGPAGTIITNMLRWASVSRVHSLQWVIEKLGMPTDVYVDPHGISAAAVWRGVYITVYPSQVNTIPAKLIRKTPYSGPIAPAVDGIALLTEILGEGATFTITAAADCMHIRSGDIGAIVVNSDNVPGAVSYDNGMRAVGISMIDVMKSMHESTPPVEDHSMKHLGRAFYETHQYTLFLIEFVNLLAGERNKDIRGKISAEIDKTVLPRGLNQIKRFIRTVLKDWPDDFSLILSMITAASIAGTVTRAVLHQIIDNEVYEFDNMTIASMKSMSDEDLKKALTALSHKFVIEVDKLPDDIEFPNVFQSCAINRPDDRRINYCSKRKLMIDVPLGDMIDVLAADLRNPLKSKYLLNGTWLETTLDWFNFQKHNDERILIYRV